jgi:hypothetical protein
MFSFFNIFSFGKASEDEKMIDKFLDIFKKVKEGTSTPEEFNFFLTTSFNSINNDERMILNLSSRCVKKIKSVDKNSKWRNEKKKVYTWQEIRFIIFEDIVYFLYSRHRRHQASFAVKDIEYLTRLIRTMLSGRVSDRDNDGNYCWLQFLEYFCGEGLIGDGLKRWNDIMTVLVNKLNANDVILETLWTNEKIKIPISSNLAEYISIDKESDKFYFAAYNPIEHKQIQLLGRYVDSHSCKLFRLSPSDHKEVNLYFVKSIRFCKLFDEERIYYEECRVAKIAAVSRVLSDGKFLLPEINKIIVSFY